MIVLSGPYQLTLSKDAIGLSLIQKSIQVNLTLNKASVVSTQRTPPVQQ